MYTTGLLPYQDQSLLNHCDHRVVERRSRSSSSIVSARMMSRTCLRTQSAGSDIGDQSVIMQYDLTVTLHVASFEKRHCRRVPHTALLPAKIRLFRGGAKVSAAASPRRGSRIRSELIDISLFPKVLVSRQATRRKDRAMRPTGKILRSTENSRCITPYSRIATLQPEPARLLFTLNSRGRA